MQSIDWDRYVGIPWRFGGRDFDGLDCWGLIWLFYRTELGLEIPSYDDAYQRESGARDIGALIGTQLPGWRKVEDPALGDVALINRAGASCHVGIIAPGRRLLHVESAEAASCLERIGDVLKRRTVGVFRPLNSGGKP